MTSFIVSLAIRLTIVMVAGGLAAFALRRSSYAVRHVVIAATLACAIALPSLMVLMPEWRVGVLPPEPAKLPSVVPTHVSKFEAPDALSAPRPAPMPETQQTIRPVLITSSLDADDSGAQTANAPVAFRPSLPQIVLGVWVLGIVFGLAWILIGQLGLAYVRRRATPLRSIDWRALLELERMHAGVAADVALLSSPKVSTPVTWGIFKPVIVLPESAREWTEERKRVVVRHEMAHIARRDSATQLAATLASVIYWIHPLVILAARHLRGECERACDERVLEMGTPATDYAAHLLDIAKFSRSFGAASIVSVAMARPSQLEGRLLAVLRDTPNRTRVSGKSRAFAMASAATMLIAISAFKPVAKTPQASTGDTLATRAARASASAAADARADAKADAKASARAAARASARADTDTGWKSRMPMGDEPATPATPASPAPPALPARPASPASPSAPASPSSPAPPAHPAAAAPTATPAIPAAPAAPGSPAPAAAPATPAVPATFPRMTMFANALSLDKAVATFPSLARALHLESSTLRVPLLTTDMLTDSMFEKTVPVRSGGTLELDLDTGGEINIIGTDDQKVSVRGSLGGENWRETTVALEARDGGAKLLSRYIGSSDQQSFDNSFTIRVPKKFNVRVSSAGGGVHISGVDGSFTGQTGGGNIAIEHANGEAHLSTGGGDVRVTKSKLDGSITTGGGTVRFDDVSGDILGNSGTESHMRRAYTYSFRGPDVESMSKMSEAQMEAFERSREAMERSNEAMERSQGAMKQSQKEIWRVKTKMMSDSAFRNMDSVMTRARITIERHRGAMDSARMMLDRDGESMDSERMMMEHDGDDDADVPDGTTRYRSHDGRRERVRSRSSMIVIDKDGGDIELEDAPGGARVTTGGGAISIRHSGKRISAQTGGGDIEIGAAEGSAEATTGAGDVSINLVGEGAHPVNISSGTGNVELVLPKDANATLDLETAYTENHGKHTKIKSDWPLNVTETQEWDSSHGTPRKYVRVRQDIGKGGPVIRIRTVNGDIRVKQGS